MTEEIIIAGFGGQGVLSMGKILAYSGLMQGQEVAWMPSYGPEMRGGTANCHVVISEKLQQSPIISNDMTHLLAMNQLAYDKFASQLTEDGWLVSNQALVEASLSQGHIQLDFSKIASEVKNPKVANMAAFGALITTLDMFSVADGEAAIRARFKDIDKAFLADNLKAYYLAIEQAQALEA